MVSIPNIPKYFYFSIFLTSVVGFTQPPVNKYRGFFSWDRCSRCLLFATYNLASSLEMCGAIPSYLKGVGLD
jgi:hypothetical protein